MIKPAAKRASGAFPDRYDYSVGDLTSKSDRSQHRSGSGSWVLGRVSSPVTGAMDQGTQMRIANSLRVAIFRGVATKLVV